MPPVSRPMRALPEGTWYVPASLPSARSAVRTNVPAAGSAGATGAAGAGTDTGRGEAPPRRKPHDPQNRFEGAFRCPDRGHTTVAPPVVATGEAAGGAPAPAEAAAAGGAT